MASPIMTTVTITSADVGITIARAGVLSALRYLVAGRGMFEWFTLVDDAPPFDVVPRQLFNSDMLTCVTNGNGTLRSPYVCFEDASISFNNLTVAACPPSGVLEVDCTGVLPLAALSLQRAVRAERARMPPPPLPPTPPPRNGYWEAWRPALSTPAREQVRDPAREAAARIRTAELEARRTAIGPIVVGPSLVEIEDELRAATRRQAGV
jgi:hypothetical protein